MDNIIIIPRPGFINTSMFVNIALCFLKINHSQYKSASVFKRAYVLMRLMFSMPIKQALKPTRLVKSPTTVQGLNEAKDGFVGFS